MADHCLTKLIHSKGCLFLQVPFLAFDLEMTSKETTRKLSESSSVASLRRIVYVCIVIATVSLTAVCVQSYWIAKKLNALEERGRVVVNKEDSSLGLIRNAQHVFKHYRYSHDA